MVGESAGGYLAAMVATQDGGTPPLAAFVSLCGPMDLTPLAAAPAGVLMERIRFAARVRTVKQFFGAPADSAEVLLRASPVAIVHWGTPPALFVHGVNDPIVPSHQSEEMCGRMQAAGASCEVILLPDAGHGLRNWDLHRASRAYARLITGWLSRRLVGAWPSSPASGG